MQASAAALIILLSGIVLGVSFLHFQHRGLPSAYAAPAKLSVLSKEETVPLLPVPSLVSHPSGSRTVNDLSVGERKTILEKIIPHGIPRVYGAELEISFDEPEAAIAVLSKLDGEWVNGKNGIKFSALGSNVQQRYLQISTQISCEFCCGARTLITKTGEAACQCSHSAAMRGLAKYLLQKHATEFSDQQILEELTKVKTISFPQQMVRRALELKALGKEIDAQTQNLPSQVGGC